MPNIYVVLYSAILCENLPANDIIQNPVQSSLIVKRDRRPCAHSTIMAESSSSSVRRIVINGPSFRSRLMWWVTKLIVPHILKSAPIPAKGPQVWALPPPCLRKQIAVGTVEITDWHEEKSGWHIPVLRSRSASSQNPAPRVVFYFHGGGYHRPLTPTHWGWIAWMSEKLDAEFYVVPYPLAPTNTAFEVMWDP